MQSYVEDCEVCCQPWQVRVFLDHQGGVSVTLGTLEEAGGLSQHEGEEFLHVLTGQLSFVSEFYEPLTLEPGDSLYFDSNMGHAYLSADGKPVTILVVATTEPPK